ncbi:hypothetical protein Tco_0563799 [Tanacetum coccineum]
MYIYKWQNVMEIRKDTSSKLSRFQQISHVGDYRSAYGKVKVKEDHKVIQESACVFFKHLLYNPKISTEAICLEIVAVLHDGLIYDCLEVLAIPVIPLTMSVGLLFGSLTGTILVSISGTISMSSSYNFRGNKRQDENQLTSDGEACVASDNLYVKRCDLDCGLGSFEVNVATSSQAADVHPEQEHCKNSLFSFDSGTENVESSSAQV